MEELRGNTATILDDGSVFLFLTPEATQNFFNSPEPKREGYMILMNALGKAVAEFGGGWRGEEVDAFLVEVIEKRFNTYFDPQLFIRKSLIEQFMFEAWRAYKLAVPTEKVEKAFEQIKIIMHGHVKDQFHSVLNGFLTEEERKKKQQLEVAKFAHTMGMNMANMPMFQLKIKGC